VRQGNEPSAAGFDARRLTGALRLAFVSALILAGLLAFLMLLIGRAADERAHALLATEIDRSAATVADALRPVLRAASPGDAPLIAEAMDTYAAPDRILRLYFTPADSPARAVFFIAGAPAQMLSATDTAATQQISAGLFGESSAACRPAQRPAGASAGDFLWAAVPVANPSGCWWLVATTAVAAAGPSFLVMPPIRSAGLAAAAAALLMLTAIILAMTQARRLRTADSAQGFEITAVDDPALLPQPANDRALAGGVVPEQKTQGHTTADILDLRRAAIDLSGAVRAYVDGAHARLGSDAARLEADLEDGISIEGRAEYVRTILDELIGPALRAPPGSDQSGAGAIQISLRAEDVDERPTALLMVVLPQAPFTADVGGRLALIKQFALALAATASLERQADGRETVRLRFAVSSLRPPLRADIGQVQL